nr:MAG TPA: N acetylmuramidase [Caudoviricetes sp.]
MGVIDNAVTRALEIAADDSHGYDQANRWGPDYDCSSLVIDCFKRAGLPLSCTYTGNMRGDMLRCGFEDVTGSVDLTTGAGLERGDVLLNHVHHTALYIGGGQLVQASINEYGGTTGGRTGDQTGREIYTRGYYNYPWDCVLRYTGAENADDPESTPAAAYWPPRLLQYRPGLRLMVGPDVRAVQALLLFRGYNLEVDGEYGPATAAAVGRFQTVSGLDTDSECGPRTWAALLALPGGDAA